MNGIRTAFAPVVPAWALGVFFLVATTTALLVYRSTRAKLGEPKARAVSLLRLGTVWLLCAFALNPTVAVKKVHTTHPAVAVVLDASRSMELPSSGGEASRFEAAKSILTGGEHPLLKSLVDEYGADLYALADSLRPLGVPETAGVAADGKEGDLREALKEIGRAHSVAVLLSDGNVRWAEGEADPPPGSLFHEKLPPVIAVPVGSLEEYRDVLIERIEAPPLAFRGREVRFDVTLKSYGYAGTAGRVLLRDSEGLLAAERVLAKSDRWEETVSLSFIPVEAGRKDITISVPPQAGEAITANNNIAVSLKVVRDKTRVLMVSGNPSLSYRFLRAALKNDPSIDLLSFVILRDPSDILDVPTREQSLIPFPVDTLFSKELSDFDLLIFDNFDYSLFLNPGHLQSIGNFVRAGGGFGAFGGPNLFPVTLRGENPVTDLLPVRYAAQGSYVTEGRVGVRVNSEGAEHPLMARFSMDVLGGEREGPRFWRDMPSLDGINETNAKENATVLLEAADGFPWPILTVTEYGKGRVLALGTDYAWKWSMGMVARGEGNQPYLGLVHWIVRWLVRDPSLDAIQIGLPERAVSAGEEIGVRIGIRGKKSSGQTREAVSFSVTDPDGHGIESRLERTPQPGEYIAYFRPEKGGIYRMEVATPFASASESIAAAGPLDALDSAPDAELLARIASSTGGKVLSPGEDLRGEIEKYAAATARRFIEERRLPLWANPFALAAVLGLLGMEWYLRRRWGLM